MSSEKDIKSTTPSNDKELDDLLDSKYKVQ